MNTRKFTQFVFTLLLAILIVTVVNTFRLICKTAVLSCKLIKSIVSLRIVKVTKKVI